MSREDYENTLRDLGEATDAYAPVADQVEILATTPKAIRIRASCGVVAERAVWLPKSQCASRAYGCNGRTLFVKRSWLTRERLWWLT
jgi:hypothetical protein